MASSLGRTSPSLSLGIMVNSCHIMKHWLHDNQFNQLLSLSEALVACREKSCWYEYLLKSRHTNTKSKATQSHGPSRSTPKIIVTPVTDCQFADAESTIPPSSGSYKFGCAIRILGMNPSILYFVEVYHGLTPHGYTRARDHFLT